MFSKNFKSILIVAMLLVMVLGYVVLYADCDMAVMLAKTGYNISTIAGGSGDYDDPDEFIDFLINFSSASYNHDGYGIIYVGNNGYFPYINTTNLLTEFYSDHAWYVTAQNITSNTYYYDYFYNNIHWYTGPMEAARDAIKLDDNDVAIVLGHDRRSSTALGNHPFRFDYGTSTFQFMHNGGIDDDIKHALYTELGGTSWFSSTNHPSNWNTNYSYYDQFIDSEILFHWIMSNIMDNDGDVLSGIQDALTATVDNIVLQNDFSDPYYQDDYWHNVVNFVLTDGETLYLFRNGGNSWNHHLLSWQENENNSYTVKTQTELENGLNQFDCVVISRDEEPIVYSNFLEMKIFSEGSEGYNWDSFPLLVRDATTNEAVDIVPILQTIEPFDDIENIFFEAVEDVLIYDYDGFPYQWNYPSYDIQSTRLYKIKADPYVQRTLELSGTRMKADYELEYSLSPYTYQWLGYWLPESQNIVDAFGDLWQYVEKVKSEDWYYNKCSIIRGDPFTTVSWSTENKTLEYGKGYMVWFKDTSPIPNFQWTTSGTTEEPKGKVASENFTYTEKADYEVIDVVNIPSNVTEIGVFEDEVCVGAVVVEDSCAQILVYSDSANRDPVPFNYEIVTGRGFSTPIKDYLVLNQATGEFEPSVIISGRQGYSVIKLGEQEEPENIVSRPVLHGNYPNPFNPTTTISFSVTQNSDFVTLEVYNIKGQKIKTLYKGIAEEGKHLVIWDGKDTNDKSVGSGIYFYKLKTNNKELTRKMIMIK